MKESKIELTERLRRANRWNEASRFKDTALKELRAKGLKRAEAADAAWEAMAEKYLPAPKPAPTPMTVAPAARVSADVETYGAEERARGETTFDIRLFDAILIGIERWSRYYGINSLPPKARPGLFASVLATVNWCYDHPPTPLPPPEMAPPSTGVSAKVEIDVKNERAKNLASFDMLLFEALPSTIYNWCRDHGVNVPPDANQGLFITILVAVIWAWRRLST